jgi:formylglycine-generating enzyme required for sulfatase activity
MRLERKSEREISLRARHRDPPNARTASLESRMRKWLLVLGALVAGLVHAHASVVAVVVPLPLALAILALFIAAAVILLAITGMRRVHDWLSTKGRRTPALVYVTLIVVIAAPVTVWLSLDLIYRIANFDPYVLTAERERALKPLEAFRECAKDCPEMIVIPAGRFMMGSPVDEKGRRADEDDGHGRQHEVRIERPFAVAKFDVTFADWDVCVKFGGCLRDGQDARVTSLRDMLRAESDKYPVFDMGRDDAKVYVAWLSRMTGKVYRLLSEAEWEYAARAGTTTAYFWGDEVGKENANCAGCGSRWDYRQPSPVGSFRPNAFGLYDMAGNVRQWVEDCYHRPYQRPGEYKRPGDYNGAPADGSAWTGCGDLFPAGMLRGGSWADDPRNLRSASRTGEEEYSVREGGGFRVARTLVAP